MASCSANRCDVSPNASVQPKVESKADTRQPDAKTENKSVVEQMRDLRDSLHPGAQLKCVF